MHRHAPRQDVFLFSDTVEGNIAFGNQNLTEEEVKDFARQCRRRTSSLTKLL